jgi:hypothetical protein
MYRQVEGLVKSIDERARDARQTVVVQRLEVADPILVQATLTSLMPKITVSTSRNGTQRRRRDPNSPDGQQPSAPGGNDADLMRRAAQQQQMMTPGPGQFGAGQFGGANAVRPQNGNAARPQNGGGNRTQTGGGAGGNRAGGARRTGN